MRYPKLDVMRATANMPGRSQRVVSGLIHRQHGIPDSALEYLVCNGCGISEEFVGEKPIRWEQVVVGECFEMRGGRCVVAEVNELTHTAWLIREEFLVEPN